MAQQKERPQQIITGRLSLKDVAELLPDLRIKIAVARDCRVIRSQVFALAANQRELEFSLSVSQDDGKPVGVRLLVGPDVPDEQLRSIEHHQRWVPARSFGKDGVSSVELRIPDRLYRCWRLCCRRYTLRGRVVCRRWVWDPIEQMFVPCDAPVRGAKVTAFDVDCFWWWCRRDAVGADFTDLNGNFEISFTWCCWWWRPWLLHTWQLEPALVDRIRRLLRQVPMPIPEPTPDPVPDLGIFHRLVTSADMGAPRAVQLDRPTVYPEANFVQLAEDLVARLPRAPELEALHVWPWRPFRDCRPDITFEVTQDCGQGDRVIYTESRLQTRWNVDSALAGVTLVANDDACCAPVCCTDPPDDDCLVFHGVGCGSYPFDQIEQNVASPLVGYARPGTADAPFGGTIALLGVFGDGSHVDYYKVQRRRILPAPTAWQDLPAAEVGAFSRGHWLGVFPWFKYETVELLPVDGQMVLRTTARYRAEHPEVDATVDPSAGDRLTNWVTASGGLGSGAPMPGLTDGVYELRVVGYRYDTATGTLVDQKIMALCPPPGHDVDPAAHATFRLSLDNRVVSTVPGSVHLNTTEPDCDFPTICAVVKNEDPMVPLALQRDRCVDACGIVRVSAGDTLTVHFQASDSDGHLEGYSLTAHWADSDVFDVLSTGTLAADPDALIGPTYAQTFVGGQGVYRAGLPVATPEHARPFWYGGHFKVTTTVGAAVPASPHAAFATCCAFLLRLRVWKRTTDGCTGGYYFHANHCEFSFTVIREDLIGNPAHPSCTEICPPEPQAGAVVRR